MARFYVYMPGTYCSGIYKNTGFCDSRAAAETLEMKAKYPDSVVVDGYRGDRILVASLLAPLECPPDATDWIDTLLSESEIRFFKRFSALGMNLLAQWDGVGWHTCSHLPWELLKPIASFHELQGAA